jgi:hypothetical protein
MSQPRVTSVAFDINEGNTTCTVNIDAAGCPGVMSGKRVKVFPPITKLAKLRAIIDTFEGKHPKDWPIVT